MKFTSMQQALAAGAIGAVASVSALADTGYGNGGGNNTAELVLYVVNTATGAAYSRGLARINGLNSYLTLGSTTNLALGTGISGAISINGATTTLSLASGGDTATIVAAQTAFNTISGATTGYGSQAQISVNFSLPTVTPDPNLITWLAANAGASSGDIKWSIQGGYSTGNGASASRRYVTTSATNYDAGISVTNSNLGMSVTESNVWASIASTQYADNLLTASTNLGDGTSITNSTYFATSGPGTGSTDTAQNWFATSGNSTNPALSVNPLCSIGSACNLYFVPSNNVNTAGGGRVFVFTMNDVMLDSAGYLRSIGHK